MKNNTRKIFVILLFIIIVNLNRNIFAMQYKNTTKAYFLSEVTNGYGNGDCILLENYDSNGQVHYGLIDTGREIKTKDNNGNSSTKVNDFLKLHMKTNELDFVIITHSHGDHNGDTITVINNFNIKKIYMKEYDNLYSSNDGWQAKYEEIIKKAVEKNIKIIGCDYESVISRTINPSTSDEIIEFLNKNSHNKKLFNKFNENNTKFDFGSSKIKILNWEFFNKDGAIWNYGDDANNREIVKYENNNSLGVLLIQGNKKAFFSGDINNYDKNKELNRLGDEDRLKNIIGDIDLLKLGHHGYEGSNTEDYLNILKPEYTVITNDISRASKNTIDWLKKNNTEYLYTTVDKKAVIATITNETVNLNFETSSEIKNINKKLYYICKNTKEESDWKKLIYNIEYKETQKEVRTWNELKEVINENKNNYLIDNDNKKVIIEKLKILINNNEKLIADNNIEIDRSQFITILPINNNDINIVRNISYKKELFTVYGSLTIGKPNMQSKIILDGNKEKVVSESSIIAVDTGILNTYDGVIIQNNNNTVTENNKLISNESIQSYNAYGSGIALKKESTFNMYGGEISNNTIENNKKLQIENSNSKNNYAASCFGTGIYISGESTFNMYGGKIINNSAKNNSKFIFKNIKFKEGTYTSQHIKGVGIYSTNSKLNIKKGEISNNIAQNNSTIEINSGEIYKSDNSIYGIGMFSEYSDTNINNTKIKNNIGINNTKISSNNNSISNNSVNNITGGAICLINLKAEIKTSEISDTKVKNNIKIEKSEDSNIKFINYLNGGGIYSKACNLILEDCKLQNNLSGSGGGVYVSDNNSITKIINTNISNNIAENGNGGGIYAQGKVFIRGLNSKINKNHAKEHGGGAIIKDLAIIEDAEICQNKAEANSGGGIRVDGRLVLVSGKISENIAQTTGGGIDYTNGTLIKDNTLILKNLSNTYGTDNIYPQNSKITKDETPPEIKLNYNKEKEKGKYIFQINIEVKDLLSEVKQVTINGKNLKIPDDGIIKLRIDRKGKFIVIAKDYIGNTATKKFTISNLNQVNKEKKSDILKKIEEKNNLSNTKEATDKENQQEDINLVYDNTINSIKNINQTTSIKESSTQDLNEEIIERTEENTQKNTNNQADTDNLNKTNAEEISKETQENKNTEINDKKKNSEENLQTEEEQIIENKQDINSQEIDETDSNYIDDEQVYKEVQDSLSNDMPKTGQKSLTFIFSVLGIIAFENYIKLRKYREIL